jgi:polyhydroxyalkanoate synthesis regulator phasin
MRVRNPLALVRAVRTLQERADRQHKRIARLETEVGRLTAQVDALERRVGDLSPPGAPPSP